MSAAVSSHDTQAQDARSYFLRSRLGSLLAVLPLSVWVLLHLWNNLSVFKGPEAWQRAVTEYDHPIAQLAGLLVSLIPIALHTVWGVGRLVSSRPNYPKVPHFSNLKYLFQRISALGVLLFLGAHIFKATVEPRLIKGHAESFRDIAWHMGNHPATLAVYLLGTLAVAYHLGNGLSTFSMAWGLVSSKKGLRRADVVGALAFFVFWAMSWAVLFQMYRMGHGQDKSWIAG